MITVLTAALEDYETVNLFQIRIFPAPCTIRTFEQRRHVSEFEVRKCAMQPTMDSKLWVGAALTCSVSVNSKWAAASA